MMFAFIPSPAHNGFHIGPLFVHAYGLMYVLAVIAAILVTRWQWVRAGGRPELPAEIAAWAFPGGLIGGRIYFLITTPSQIPPHWWGAFAIWKGGLGIWGGIAGGVLTGIWRVKRKKLSKEEIRLLLDCAAPGLLVAQAIGRIGNYFNQELFGAPSSLPWALEISPAHRPPGYGGFATFEPTFLYELTWNLLLAAFLVWLNQRRRVQIRPPGIFALYVAGYSGFRIFEETQRIDYSVHVLGLRLNFFIATILCLIGLVWFVACQRGWSIYKRPPPSGRPGSGISDRTPPPAHRTQAAAGAPARRSGSRG
jgi:prolipoprotein diacylglyceryl transferase